MIGSNAHLYCLCCPCDARNRAWSFMKILRSIWRMLQSLVGGCEWARTNALSLTAEKCLELEKATGSSLAEKSRANRAFSLGGEKSLRSDSCTGVEYSKEFADGTGWLV